ncbi:MAG: hypothetical protein AAFV29_26985, partial [Myxococcota bacterium]
PLEKCVITPGRDFYEMRDYRGDFDHPGFFGARIGGKVNLNAQFRLGAAPNEPCPHETLILNALGLQAPTNIGPTERLYVPNSFSTSSNDRPLGLTLMQQSWAATTSTRFDAYAGYAKGVLFNKLGFSIAEGQPLNIYAEGEFTDYQFLGGGVSGTAANSSASLTELGDSIDAIRTNQSGIYVSIGADNNGGLGYRVARNSAGLELLDTTWTGPSGAYLLLPLVVSSPSPYADTLHPTPTNNTLVISTPNRDDRILPFISADITLDTGLRPRFSEFNAEVADTIGQSTRRLYGQVVTYMQNESMVHVPSAFDGRYHQMTFTFGPAPDRHVQVVLPRTRWEVAREIPF